MRIVSPYRPFVAEKHQGATAITVFDWLDALQMLNVSAQQQCGVDAITVLTDRTTVVPLPALRYRTSAKRLQQWLIEIRLAYLASPAFDQDTVLVSPDTLLVADIGAAFDEDGDLLVLVRTKPTFDGRWESILNSVQWWRHSAKRQLVAFYRRAVDIGRTLPEDLQVWGGDTEAIRQLLDPVEAGVRMRAGLRVHMLPAKTQLRSLSEEQIAALVAGDEVPQAPVPVLDFKYTRKRYMRAMFETLYPQPAGTR